MEHNLTGLGWKGVKLDQVISKLWVTIFNDLQLSNIAIFSTADNISDARYLSYFSYTKPQKM